MSNYSPSVKVEVSINYNHCFFFNNFVHNPRDLKKKIIFSNFFFYLPFEVPKGAFDVTVPPYTSYL